VGVAWGRGYISTLYTVITKNLHNVDDDVAKAAKEEVSGFITCSITVVVRMCTPEQYR
jgi:hypothetical protein